MQYVLLEDTLLKLLTPSLGFDMDLIPVFDDVLSLEMSNAWAVSVCQPLQLLVTVISRIARSTMTSRHCLMLPEHL